MEPMNNINATTVLVVKLTLHNFHAARQRGQTSDQADD